MNKLGVRAWLIFALLLACVVPAYCGSTCVYELPMCPKGMSLKVYAPIQVSHNWVETAPVIDNVIDVRDAKPYLESLGVSFAEDAYALYFGKTRTLIVATTSENHDALTVVFDS